MLRLAVLSLLLAASLGPATARPQDTAAADLETLEATDNPLVVTEAADDEGWWLGGEKCNDVKLGPRHNYHEGRAAISRPNFTSTYRGVNVHLA